VPAFVAQFRWVRWLDANLPTFPGEGDRIPDTVGEFISIEHSEDRRLVDFEFQSSPHPDMLERIGEYMFRLRRTQRFGSGQAGKYGVAGVVVNMTGAPQPDELDTTETLLDGAGVHLKLLRRTLRDEDAVVTLAGIATGRLDRCVLPWLPLLKGADQEAMITEWRRVAEGEPDPHLRGDYAVLALTLSSLADRRESWEKGLEGFNVVQSEYLTAHGVALRREDLKFVLEGKFQSPLPLDLTGQIDSTDDPMVLRRWALAAARADTLESFRAQMGTSPPPGP
jgi:hypothetical protein